jgi:hypothetical protein
VHRRQRPLTVASSGLVLPCHRHPVPRGGGTAGAIDGGRKGPSSGQEDAGRRHAEPGQERPHARVDHAGARDHLVHGTGWHVLDETADRALLSHARAKGQRILGMRKKKRRRSLQVIERALPRSGRGYIGSTGSTGRPRGQTPFASDGPNPCHTS